MAVAFLVGFSSGSCTPASVAVEAPLEAFTGHLETRLPEMMKESGVPGLSIALIQEGRTVWSGAYGHADVAIGRRLALDAVFRVESISKPVTAWGVLRLVDLGLISLDDPAEEHLGRWKLPEAEFSTSGVTVRRLLSNTSGMPLGTVGLEYPAGTTPPSLSHVLDREARLVGQPGSGFLYSNTGYNLLELLVEEVTGRDFSEFMDEQVLHPLGMERATFSWEESLRPFVPMGYDLRGNPVTPYVYSGRASGGLFATLQDVAAFVTAGMVEPGAPGHEILSDEGIRALYRPEAEHPGVFSAVSDAYGLGHFIEALPDGRTAVWHGGQGHGWMTHFHMVPETGDGIVILTNSQRSWPLMSEILTEWARWSGHGSVKMGRISLAARALKVSLGALVLLNLIQATRLIAGLRKGTRRLNPFVRESVGMRTIQGTLGAGVMLFLGWCVMQPYLLASSVFPVTATWAGWALLLLSGVLIASALSPRRAGCRSRGE